MASDPAVRTGADLCALARMRGYFLSPAQLARWQRAGLLPRPHRQGLGRGHGSRAVYAPVVSEQVLLLCAFHARTWRLRDLAWLAWWTGFPVALPAIREQLRAAAATLSGLVAWCVMLARRAEAAQIAGDDDPLLDAAERLAAARLNSRPLRRVRRRIGRDGFVTFVRMLVPLAAGTPLPASATMDRAEQLADLRILARGLGLDERFVRRHANLDHYLAPVLASLLREAGTWVRSCPWKAAVARADDFELLQARDALRQALRGGEWLHQINPRLLREYPHWAGALAVGYRDATPREQAPLLAMWLALSTPA